MSDAELIQMPGGGIGEFLGAFALAATLIYLPHPIRESTRYPKCHTT